MLPNHSMKSFIRPFVKPLASAMAIATCAVTGHAMVATAQGLPGLSIRWGQNEGFNELGYVIELSKEPRKRGRYRLKIGARDMKLAVSQFTVNIPDHFDGKFREEEVELRACSKPGTIMSRPKCDTVPLDEVSIDMEAGQISIYPQAPVAAGTNVELVFHQVRNPRNSGFYQFNALVEVPGDVPLLRNVGSWNLDISRD